MFRAADKKEKQIQEIVIDDWVTQHSDWKIAFNCHCGKITTHYPIPGKTPCPVCGCKDFGEVIARQEWLYSEKAVLLDICSMKEPRWVIWEKCSNETTNGD